MSVSGAVGRRDRIKAFVPELIPEPEEVEASGPLTPREQKHLKHIHEARDNHANAGWMRGKALEAAFSRRLYRGEDGTRSRQEYLNDEWDGISESAAYLEIREWRLAAQIALTSDRPAPDSHTRALVDVAEAQGAEEVAKWYAELRRHGQDNGLRVTAEVVANLAEYLASGGRPGELGGLFVPRQLPRRASQSKKARKPREAVKGGADAPFQNFGMGEDGGIVTPSGGWSMGPAHVERLSACLEEEARELGIDPGQAADLLVKALRESGGAFRDWIRAQTEA